MKPKSIFESRVFWFSIISVVLTAVNEALQGLAVTNTELIGVIAVLNIVLRFFTERPVKLA